MSIHKIYPTATQIEAAGVRDLLGWNRFLPSPADDKQRELLNRITARLGEVRGQNPDAYTEASKSLSW